MQKKERNLREKEEREREREREEKRNTLNVDIYRLIN